MYQTDVPIRALNSAVGHQEGGNLNCSRKEERDFHQ